MLLVRFNPWYFASEAALVQGFYGALEEALTRRYIIPGLPRTLALYKSVLSFGLQHIGFKSVLPTAQDPDRLRRKIEEWVSRSGCRLVVVIDDIDRLMAKEAVSVFKLATLSARFRNTIFVLSFDPNVVSKVLREEAKFDVEFLEKIVQKPIRLPAVDQSRIDRFLLYSDEESDTPDRDRSAIHALLDEVGVEKDRRVEFDKEFVQFYQASLRSYFSTLRRAKRYINQLRASLPPVSDDVNLYDFFLLEILAAFFPAVHRDIWTNRWYYLPGTWSFEGQIASRLPLRNDDSEERDETIRNHIDGVLKDEREQHLVKSILRELFPQVGGAIRANKFISVPSPEQSEASRRVTHPECFYSYFLDGRPHGVVSSSAVEPLVQEWNELDDERELARAVVPVFRSYNEEGLMVQFLSKLRLFINNIAADRTLSLVRVLCFQVLPEVLDRNTRTQLVLFIIETVDKTAREDAIASILRDLVSEATSVVAVEITYYCLHRDYSPRINDLIDTGQIKDLVNTLLDARYLQEKWDIFEDLPHHFDLAYVLAQWGTDFRTSKKNLQKVQDYLMTTLSENPRKILRLLMGFTQFLEGKANAFDYSSLKQISKPDEIYEMLQRNGEALGDLVGEEERCVEFFEKVVHPVNGEVPPVKGRPWKLPHYANRGKTSSSGGELASARSCFSTVRTALGKLRITGLLARFDVARSFPFPRPLLLQPTIWTSERGADLGSGRCQPRPHLPIYRMTLKGPPPVQREW